MATDLLKQPPFVDQPERRPAQARLTGTAGYMGDDLGVGTGLQRCMPIADIQRIAAGEQLPVTNAGRLADHFVALRLAHLTQDDQVLESADGSATNAAIGIVGHDPAQCVMPHHRGIDGRAAAGGIRGVNVGTRISP